MAEWSFTNKVVVPASPVPVNKLSDIAPVLSKEILDTQKNIECGFSLKCAPDMTRTYCQVQRTDKCSQYSSVSW